MIKQKEMPATGPVCVGVLDVEVASIGGAVPY